MSGVATVPSVERMTRRHLPLVVSVAWALALAVLAVRWLGSATGSAVPYPWSDAVALNPVALLSPTAGSALLLVTALVVLALLLAPLLAPLLLRRRAVGRLLGRSLVVLGLAIAALVSDISAIQLVGYLPLILLWTVAGTGPEEGFAWEDFWPSVFALSNAAGGVAVAVVGLRMLAAETAHRPGAAGQAPSRRDRLWVAVAVAVPAFYALTRIAWVLGIPFGVSRETLDNLGDGVSNGLGLAVAALGGALLTWGLVAQWGEAFPSWLPWFGGRDVPVGLAVWPACFVSAIVMSGGVTIWTMTLVGQLDQVPGEVSDWGAWLPLLLWPLWSVALAAAARGYALRRGRSTARPAGPAGSTSDGPAVNAPAHSRH